MGDYSQPQLEAMGLCPFRVNLDQHIRYGDWDQRRNFHTLVRAANNQEDKPLSTVMWRTKIGTNVPTAVRCNMGIHVIKLSAIIPGGNDDGTDKDLPEEYYLCKKETGVWTLKYLTSAEGSHKQNSHLTQASNSDNYSVANYNQYVPKQVMDAMNIYKTLYFNKHHPNDNNLTMVMINAGFISFKCDLQMDEEDMINDHVYDVHNVSGIRAMKPVQKIKVDAQLPFTMPNLMEIELSGPDKRSSQVHSIYTRCVARSVVSKTNNKGTADLIECRSQEFMTELSKGVPTNFFSRFKMHLNEALEGLDIDTDFTCKWSMIEQSLYKAISKEQNTIRLANFYEKDYSQFHSMPMEIVINQVDTYVDNVLGKSTTVFVDKKGRTLCNYLYSIRWKYKLVFEIARHLSDDFKLIKEHIMRECTNMHDNLESVIDISEFQKNIKGVFETKGVMTQFTNENIPMPKKSMAVHEAKVKNDNKKEKVEDTKELLAELEKKYRKEKISFKDDTALQNEIDTLALKLAEDPANADAKVVFHNDIVSFLKTKKKKVCWCCRKVNCLIKQTCSQKLKMNKKFVGDCKGKQTTFKELKEFKPTESKTATAQITIPATADSDSDSEFLANAFNDMRASQEANDEFGFKENVAEFTVERPVNAETVPSLKN